MTANTQRKINLLQEVAEGDASLNLVLDKLLNVMRSQYASRIARYETDLRNFEKRCGMSSAAFYQQFEAGQLGDAMDFFEWSGLFELWQDLQIHDAAEDNVVAHDLLTTRECLEIILDDLLSKEHDVERSSC